MKNLLSRSTLLTSCYLISVGTTYEHNLGNSDGVLTFDLHKVETEGAHESMTPYEVWYQEQFNEHRRL